MSSSNTNWFCSLKEKNGYSQVFLQEFKYTEKEKNMIRYITADLEISYQDSDEKLFL